MHHPADHGARAPQVPTRECLTHKDESPGVQAERSKVFTECQHCDSASLGVSDQAHDATQFASLQHHLAVAGWIVSREAGGCFNVTRWGQTRTLDTLQELRAFAKQIGATHA